MPEMTGGLPGKRPNVLFILVDQLRADVCGTYGGVNIATPHIDRLAKEGMVFDNAITSCPVCSPYRGMLMTGRYPTQTGILLNFVETSVAQNPNCIANVFSNMGYDTGYIGKWHLAAGIRKRESVVKPNYAAIERYVAENPHYDFVPPGPGRLGFQYWAAYNFNWTFRNYWYYGDTPEKQYSGRYETDTQADQAIAYMRAHEISNRPFFLVVSPHPPHAPMTREESPPGYLEAIPEKLHWSPNVPRDNPRSLLEMRCYLAMAKNIDDNVGRILDYLDASSLAEDTIIVFTSDHGEMHGSHGRIQKMVPYTEALNVPLIIRWPKRTPRGVRSRTVFTPLDYFSTLTCLSGLPAPVELAGRDLSDALQGHESAVHGDALEHFKLNCSRMKQTNCIHLAA
jgi:arylsulfatase A-like enzyme